MFINVRQKPPKNGWYEVEYDPRAPAIPKDNRRAFYNGMWKNGRFPHFNQGLNSIFPAGKATSTTFRVTNLFWSNK